MMNRIRKLTKACAAVVMMLIALLLSFSSSLADTENGFEYTIDSNGATVTGYTGTEIDVIIPNSLGGYPVTAIRSYAFRYETFKSIILPETLTSIGSHAFDSCKSLSSISIPNNVTAINDHTFYFCTSLTSVTIGNSVSSIGENAFYFCTSLTDVTFGNNVSSIDKYAFGSCANLSRIVFPDSLVSLANYAFSGCSNIESIVFSPNITSIGLNALPNSEAVFYAPVGSLTSHRLQSNGYSFTDIRAPYFTFKYYSNTGWTVTAFDGSLTDVVIPEGVENIQYDLFKGNTSLTAVSFPSTLKTIGSQAFSGCTNLTSIDIPAGVQTIGSGAFQDCLKLTSVTLHEGLQEIGSNAFYDCTNLPSIDIPASVKTIRGSAFGNCLSLASVTLREGLETIEYSAFYRCIALKSISLPNTLTSFSGNVFSSSGVTEVILPENITEFSGYGDTVRFYVSRNSKTAQAMATKPNYSFCAFTDPQWPNLSLYYLINEYTGDLSLHLYKYHGRNDISVTIPDGIVGIYHDAFNQYNYSAGIAYNSVLQEIHIPDSVTSIGSNAFTHCSALGRVYLPDNVVTFGTYIADTRNSAADSPILYCDKNSITAKNITTNVYPYGFTDPDEPDYSLAYESNGALVLTAYRGTNISPALPAGITAIGERAFYENKRVQSVSIPEGVTEIRSAAFQYCTALKDISFPSTLLSIGSSAFNGSDALSVITLPDSLTTLGSNSFVCSLDEIHLPDNITTVETYPFYDSALIFCKKGSTTAYNVSAENTGYRLCDPADPDWKYRYDEDGGLLFGGYRGTNTELTIPDIYVGISDYAFSDSDHLVKIVVPDSVKSLGYASLRCNAKEIHLPDHIASIHQEAINSWGSTLYFLNIDSQTFQLLTALGHSFSFCDTKDPEWTWSREKSGKLYINGYRGKDTDITLPAKAEGVTREFSEETNTPNRESITTIRLQDNIRYIGTNAFLGFISMTELYLPDNIEEFDIYPFDIDNWVFLTIYCTKGSKTAQNLCAASEEYIFCDPSDPDWLWRYENDGSLSLGGYRGIARSITLPAGATSIANDAFDRRINENIISIVIPEGYTSIGDHALAIDDLSQVSLPSTLRSIGREAFWGCEFASIQLPEGLETIGEEAFSACHNLTSLFIPSTVTRIEKTIIWNCDELTTVILPAEIQYIAPECFGDALRTVYCYRNTYGHSWATDNGYTVKLIGSGTLEGLVQLSMIDEYDVTYSVFDVGSTFPFMSGVSVGTLPPGAKYTYTCKSSNTSVVRVDGDMLTFLSPGTATITIGIAERSDVTPLKRTIEVFNPVTDFTVPKALFIPRSRDEVTKIYPANIKPANANPYFKWSSKYYSNGWRNAVKSGISFYPEDELGAINGEILSYSGVSRPLLFVTYNAIGNVYANPPARALVVDQLWEPDVTVMVDGAEYEKYPELYTIKSSNTSVAAVTEDKMIRAVAPGNTTITITAISGGKTASFALSVTESVILYLPAALTSVSEEAFVGVSAGEIVIPDGCTSIGSRAFADCANLYAVTIPASVTHIARDAFEGCEDVNIIAPKGSEGQAVASENASNGFTFTAM